MNEPLTLLISLLNFIVICQLTRKEKCLTYLECATTDCRYQFRTTACSREWNNIRERGTVVWCALL